MDALPVLQCGPTCPALPCHLPQPRTQTGRPFRKLGYLPFILHDTTLCRVRNEESINEAAPFAQTTSRELKLPAAVLEALVTKVSILRLLNSSLLQL